MRRLLLCLIVIAACAGCIPAQDRYYFDHNPRVAYSTEIDWKISPTGQPSFGANDLGVHELLDCPTSPSLACEYVGTRWR